MVNQTARGYLTEGELEDVKKALHAVETSGKIGDLELKKRLYAIIQRVSGGEKVLPDFDPDSSLLKDSELVNPFREPEEGDDISQRIGAPRSANNGALARDCRDLVNRRFEQLKNYFGIKDPRISDVFYHLIEGTVTRGDWEDFFLDTQEDYIRRIEAYNGPCEYSKKMWDWISRERQRRREEHQGKRKSSSAPNPWPPQSGRPPAGPPPEGAYLVNAGTERFE